MAAEAAGEAAGGAAGGAAGEAGSAAGQRRHPGAGEAGMPRLGDLETERVELDGGLCFTWHRPPRREVERQWRDPATVRIFLNGCFDLMHVGHFNALRQAKAIFYQKGYAQVVLVAGLHSDAAITGAKGPPVLTEEERLAVLRGTKWVDELATNLPYAPMTAQMADALLVHWICHGDDVPAWASGGGMYADAMEKGRFQMLKRTEGISTTRILERLLCRLRAEERWLGQAFCGTLQGLPPSPGSHAPPEVPMEAALATTQRLAQFAAPADPRRAPRSLGGAARVVYVAGTFDLLHEGHVRFLDKAATLGDYLLVGLYSDETLRARRRAPSVLTLPERALAVLALRAVDDVVLGAPWELSRELLVTLNVAVVAIGRQPAARRPHAAGPGVGAGGDGGDGDGDRRADERWAAPCCSGLLAEVDSGCDISADSIRQRFLARSTELSARNGMLLRRESAYLGRKRPLPEA